MSNHAPKDAECSTSIELPEMDNSKVLGNTNRREFKKLGGAATTLGQQFEYGLVALLYMRIIDWAESFFLGSNLQGLGLFDDVFLKLNWEDKGGIQKSQVYCIQLKHKEKERQVTTAQLLKDKGDFSVLSYYESYCKLKDAIESDVIQDNSDIIRENTFNEYNFILYTNSTVEHKSIDKCDEDMSRVETLLHTGGEQRAIFSFGPEDDEIWGMRDEYGDSGKYHEFLLRFRIFSGQSRTGHLTELVDKEVVRCAQVEGKASKELSSDFIKSIENWWNHDNAFLTTCSPQWNGALIKYLNANVIDSLQKCKYTFALDNTGLDDYMRKNAFLNIIVPGVDVNIRCLKIWALLEHAHRDRYLLMNASDLNDRKEQVISLYQRGFYDLLVINTNERLDTQHLIGDLYPTLNMVYLVSGRKLETAEVPTSTYEDIWSLDQLTQESQVRIYESVVNFQGEDVSLAYLCDSDVVSRTLESKALGILLEGGKVSVGSALAKVEELYINRTLRHQSILREDVLLVNHDNDVFAVSGFPQDRFVTSNSNIFILSTAESNSVQRSFVGSDHPDKKEYMEYCNKFISTGNVHWVIYEGGHLMWRQSHGSEETPCRYIERMSSSCVGGTSCFHGEKLPDDWRERLVLVTGEPGMGKSTLLLHLATDIKKQNPASWVVHVALNNFSSTLKNMSAENINLEQLVLFLLEASHASSSTCPNLSYAIFRDSLKQLGNVTVLLDAVDEVSPHYMKQVVRIVQLLLETKVSKLYVTSRTLLQEYLQRELASVPLVLQPFSDEDQKSFLTHYLAEREGNRYFEKENCHDQSVQLLEFMNRNVTSPGRHICDVPLHARMAVDTINEMTKDSPDPIGSIETLRKLNLHQIYEQFFNKKREIYYRKYGMNTTQAALTDITKSEDKYFIKNHMNCALHVLFSHEKYSGFVPVDLHESAHIFLKEIIKEKSGIIEGVVDGKAKFVHFTFCEFLAAKWFKEWYSERKPNSKIQIRAGFTTFVKGIYKIINMFTPKRNFLKWLLESEFDQVRFFFDQMLSEKCELHQAVLTGNAQYVQATLDAGASVKELDEGGRLALHLAAAHGNAEIVSLLLKAGSAVEASDNVLGWTPMRYADRAQYLDVAIQLLQQGSRERDMRILKGKVKDKRIWRTIISAARGGDSDVTRLFSWVGSNVSEQNILSAFEFSVRAGYSQVVQVLLEHKVEVNRKDIYGRTPLYVASKRGNMEVIRVLLERGANVHVRNSDRKTPLHVASERGHIEAMRVLLDHGANVHAAGSDGWSPLHVAAWYGKVEAMRVLLDHGANVHAAGSDGRCPLHVAAFYGQVKAMRVLLDHGANVHAAGSDAGWSPLHDATCRGQVEAMRVLLDHGANVHAAGSDGRSPLHVAAWYGKVEAMRVLLDHGANVHAADSDARSPLHIAARDGNVEAIRVLLEHGANVHAADNFRRIPLHIAARDGQLEAMRVLLDYGANVHAADSVGRSPLRIAARDGQVETMRVLLDYGANVHEADSDARSPLHAAAGNGKVEAMRVLLEQGANVHAADSVGRSPLHAAAGNGKVEAMRVLLDHGANVHAADSVGRSPLHAAAGNGKVEAMRVLLEQGANVHAADSVGRSPLHAAAGNGKVEAMRVLLDHGANVHAADSDARSPLHAAAGNGKVEAMRVLLEQGANVHAADSVGRSPLHAAAGNGKVEAMRVLLEQGANVHAADSVGRSPLHAAAGNGKVEAMRVLLEQGANVHAADSVGRSPLHAAAGNGKVEAMRVLLEQGANVHAADSVGRSPLHAAAGNGKVEAMRVLLDYGANVHAADSVGRSPLHAAAGNGKVEAMRVLLEQGANVHAADSVGRSPLHAAAGNGKVGAAGLWGQRACGR